ncbi:MAG: apolipoprotein N-acyltransferase [Candidatus Omnitrophica bacterium]|nr:apolipoprotein N-acyltransferase [Candidatus Omnitrophota bacterium]
MASAVLLALPCLQLKLFWLAWFALVPWLLLLAQSPQPRVAFWWSWLVGFLFFLGSGWWLIHVTVVGWLLMSAYLALYFGGFGYLVTATHDTRHTTHDKTALVMGHESWVMGRLFVIPAFWVVLEYARSHLLSGFGWNLLGYSQTPWLRLIQFADVTGVWGVSFLIVLVNAAIAEMISGPLWVSRHRQGHRRAPPRGSAQWVVVLVAFAVTMGYSALRSAQVMVKVSEVQPVRVAVVQGNIPQEQKWDEAFVERISQRYESLTAEAAATHPDLIVWPETSVPGYFGGDEELTQRMLRVAKHTQLPLLVGAPVLVRGEHWLTLRNSAVLLSAAGDILDRYDKLHLVPFGEFIPGERTFPWLRRVLPPIGDFTPGDRYTVFNSQFEIRNSKFPFSTLICFEDIFPSLARRFVRDGARMLVVITNDAWFGPTAAAYQHAQASTFRAVELRVPVVRAANTGWSGCIDATGRWIGSVHDASGRELFVEGTRACEIRQGPANSAYLRFGDWFAFVCIAITLATFWYNRRSLHA